MAPSEAPKELCFHLDTTEPVTSDEVDLQAAALYLV